MTKFTSSGLIVSYFARSKLLKNGIEMFGSKICADKRDDGNTIINYCITNERTTRNVRLYIRW